MSAWKRGYWAALGAALTACSSDASLAPSTEQDHDEADAMRGHLVVQIADFDDGTADTRYFLRDAEGVEHRLIVHGNIDVAPGSKIKIRGTRRADAIELTSYEGVRESAEGTASQALPLAPIKAHVPGPPYRRPAPETKSASTLGTTTPSPAPSPRTSRGTTTASPILRS